MGAYGGTPQASMSLSTIGNKADLDGDGDVDADDLALLVGMWLSEDIPLSEDINRNGSVDPGESDPNNPLSPNTGSGQTGGDGGGGGGDGGCFIATATCDSLM